MYKADNFRTVKDEIDERRHRATASADARNAEVRAKSLEIEEIDREIGKTSLAVFRAACAGEDIAPIRKRNEELQIRRGELLLKLGYPKDYTAIRYTCEKCKDSGYVLDKMCSCMREMLILENLKSSGIGALIEKQSFENFSIERYRKSGERVYKNMANVYEKAKSYVKNFREQHGNLLFVGTTGTGKTHLSTAIAREIISQGFGVLYDSAQNIMSAYEDDRFHSGYGKAEHLSDKYTECDLLIIDDLGTEFTNQFTVSCLYNLLNTRQNRGLGTILSTNLSARELNDRYDARITSRILGSGYTACLFEGEDYRLNPCK